MIVAGMSGLATMCGRQDQLTLLIAGSFSVSLLIAWMAHAPWRPAAILLITIPIQGILTTFFGILANLFTWLIIGAFLIQFPPRHWINLLLSTRLQRLAAVFVATLSFSVVFSFQYGFNILEIQDFGQKITIIFIIALVAHGLKISKNLDRIMWILVVGMTVFVLLSAADFYLGINPFPRSGLWGNVGLLAKTQQQNMTSWSKIHDFRLRGVANTVSGNRFAFMLILPIMLTITNLGRSQRILSRITSLFCLLILAGGLIANGSRGALFGISLAIVVRMASDHKNRKWIILIILVLIPLFYLFLKRSGIPDFYSSRFQLSTLATESGRMERWEFGIQLFLRYPIFGAGAGAFARLFDDSHSSLVELLSERGLIATIPFLVLIWNVFCVYVKKYRSISDNISHWRIAFLSGFIGMFMHSLLSSYHYERIFWLSIAFAVAFEMTSNTRTVCSSSRCLQIASTGYVSAEPKDDSLLPHH